MFLDSSDASLYRQVYTTKGKRGKRSEMPFPSSRGGVAARQENAAKQPYAQTGWSEKFSDHPVRSYSKDASGDIF